MTITADYTQALELVRRLNRQTTRLVAQVVQELAQEPESAGRRSSEAWERIEALREEFRQLGPVCRARRSSLSLAEDAQGRGSPA